MTRREAQIEIKIPMPAGAVLTRALVDDLVSRWTAGKPITPCRARIVNWIGKTKRTDRDRWGVTAELKASTDLRTSFCDYDRPRPPSLRWLYAIARVVHVRPVWVRYDRTRRGWHVLIRWSRTWAPAELVALQAVLGSDPMREGLNLMRVMRHPRASTWNLLFSRKLVLTKRELVKQNRRHR
jgi:hypothetical protein